MKVLVTGSNGQLGYELARTCPASVTLLQADVAELDIADSAVVSHYIATQAPDVVINAAAYTQVDKAEQESELACKINAVGPENLARALADQPRRRLLQVSTDYVFAGNAHRPYSIDAPVAPLGVYGASKLAGETAVTELLPDRSVIIRTAWLYSARGANFVKTMLKLMAEREQLTVIADQIGSPTWGNGLARALWDVVANPAIRGVHHWTDAGVASWYDFAVAIQEEGQRLGLLSKAIPIRPIRTEDYPTPARRPNYSVLDKSALWAALGYNAPHWREALRSMMAELLDARHG